MPLLICPNDDTPMQEIDRNGVQIDVCPKCRGVWMDRGELEKLLDLVGRRDGGQPTFGRESSPREPAPGYAEQPRREYRDDDDRHRRKRKKFDLFDFFD